MGMNKSLEESRQIKGISKLITLHLLPGIILTLFYVLLLRSKTFEGYPKVIVLGLAGVFGIVFGELGYLFYAAKKEEGSFNIFKILGLKSKLKGKELFLYSITLFAIAGMLMTVTKPVSNFLLNNVFSFIPSWYNLVEDMSLFSRNMIIIAILVNFFLITIILPIIEELYFRGFLLARMKWMGKYSVLANTVLFAVYHLWSPWMIVARVVAFLPLYYWVYKKDSLKLSITVHCLANFTDVVALIALL
jgi:uncharacterized protein